MIPLYRVEGTSFGTQSPTLRRQVCTIDQYSFFWFGTILYSMSSVRVSAKQMLEIPCATCGAKPGENCDFQSGQTRKTPHRDRRRRARTLSHRAKEVPNVSPSVTIPSNLSS